MNVQSFDAVNLLKPHALVSDYLNGEDKVRPFANGMASAKELINDAKSFRFLAEKRICLVTALKHQYENFATHLNVTSNIELLLQNNTFTVTTGHQLCLLTGPLYFIYKIISTIKLAIMLGEEDQSMHFVPVFWMATEDHDFEEVNHVYIHNKKIEWHSTRKGAVGEFPTEDLHVVLEELEVMLGREVNSDRIVELIQRAYKGEILADATRFIVNELFGEYGLVIIDPKQHELKAQFQEVMKSELLASYTFHSVSETNEKLNLLNYKPAVNPREINLFYLKENSRERIVRSNENEWSVVHSHEKWNRSELLALLSENPERFSPNVLMRPLYQEFILPNLAYVGGQGELAYWLQLKSTFDKFDLKFPKLLLRDSAILLSEKASALLSKLGLHFDELFCDRHELQKKLVGGEEVSLLAENSQLENLMLAVSDKVKSVDPTLEFAVGADVKKMIGILDHLEKKMIRALKLKDDVKLKQLDKLLNEVFPDGTLQERHDNFFQYRVLVGGQLISEFLNQFNPFENKLHVFDLAPSGKKDHPTIV